VVLYIELNDAEQKLARYLARKRHDGARKRRVRDRRIGPQDALQTDLEGIAAEIVVARAMNVYPDTTIAVTETQDEDLVSRDGMFIDVKSTVYKRGRLLAAPWKKVGGVDQYILVVGTFPRYRIAGIMSADELLQEKRLVNLGHGEGFSANQNELGDFTP